jgi:hypothetical protein
MSSDQFSPPVESTEGTTSDTGTEQHGHQPHGRWRACAARPPAPGRLAGMNQLRPARPGEWRPQPPVCGAGGCVRDQLPGLDAEAEVGWRGVPPFAGDCQTWRFVECRLDFDAVESEACRTSMTVNQPSFFSVQSAPFIPDGFLYCPDAITAANECRLLDTGQRGPKSVSYCRS